MVQSTNVIIVLVPIVGTGIIAIIMTTTSDSHSVYIKCLMTMLIPVIKFCVKRSIKVHELVECVKAVMIQVAAEHVQKDSQTVSASKLSVITGMHRRDCLRLHKDGPKVNGVPSVVNRVLGHWQSAAKYRNKNGSPRILSIAGEDSEFFQLVRSVSGHLNPYTVLYELERTSSVERAADGICLKQGGFVQTDDIIESAKMMASDTEDLMSAIEENISDTGVQPNLHLLTEYDNISPEAETEIRQWLLHSGAVFHRSARDFLAKFDRDLNPKLDNARSGIRVVIGGFSRISPRELV
jgi:Family of unknown function (DUF6502)